MGISNDPSQSQTNLPPTVGQEGLKPPEDTEAARSADFTIPKESPPADKKDVFEKLGERGGEGVDGLFKGFEYGVKGVAVALAIPVALAVGVPLAIGYGAAYGGDRAVQAAKPHVKAMGRGLVARGKSFQKGWRNVAAKKLAKNVDKEIGKQMPEEEKNGEEKFEAYQKKSHEAIEKYREAHEGELPKKMNLEDMAKEVISAFKDNRGIKFKAAEKGKAGDKKASKAAKKASGSDATEKGESVEEESPSVEGKKGFDPESAIAEGTGEIDSDDAGLKSEDEPAPVEGGSGKSSSVGRRNKFDDQRVANFKIKGLTVGKPNDDGTVDVSVRHGSYTITHRYAENDPVLEDAEDGGRDALTLDMKGIALEATLLIKAHNCDSLQITKDGQVQTVEYGEKLSDGTRQTKWSDPKPMVASLDSSREEVGQQRLATKHLKVRLLKKRGFKKREKVIDELLKLYEKGPGKAETAEGLRGTTITSSLPHPDLALPAGPPPGPSAGQSSPPPPDPSEGQQLTPGDQASPPEGLPPPLPDPSEGQQPTPGDQASSPGGLPPPIDPPPPPSTGGPPPPPTDPPSPPLTEDASPLTDTSELPLSYEEERRIQAGGPTEEEAAERKEQAEEVAAKREELKAERGMVRGQPVTPRKMTISKQVPKDPAREEAQEAARASLGGTEESPATKTPAKVAAKSKEGKPKKLSRKEKKALKLQVEQSRKEQRPLDNLFGPPPPLPSDDSF